VDRESAEEYTPLSNLTPDQAKYTVYDSLLSEYAAMGFEYGYSVIRTNALVMWEAQFGDFVNGAQSIVDEYISSGEQKWGQRSGVVLLLPHGYEGQGPDHSSGRPERFLQMCAQNNMTVAIPSTPASYFHLLRWQALNPAHKPLVVFTPKSMLRLKEAVSAVPDFTSGRFEPVLPDTAAAPANVRRVILCSGKIYWDLLKHRTANAITDTAIIRVERLHPLPATEVASALAAYGPDVALRWVQEEPANQGTWPFIAMNLPASLGRTLSVVSRPPASSPAVGSLKRHNAEQAQLLAEAFA
jgi:2-oxoglutarate decarboxylase